MLDISRPYKIADTLSKYPKAKEKLKQWFGGKMLEIRNNMYKEVKEPIPAQSIPEEQIEGAIVPHFEYIPRNLYEFFDENEIYIEIFTDGKIYGYKIDYNPRAECLLKEEFKTRFDAEKAAFDQSFLELEKK